MKKKLLSFLCIGAMLFGLAGCGAYETEDTQAGATAQGTEKRESRCCVWHPMKYGFRHSLSVVLCWR